MTDVLHSHLDTSSPDYQRNREHHLRTIGEIGALVAAAKRGGGPEATARHHKRGKLLPRERIAAILDTGAPFLSSLRSRRTGSTTATRRARASSRASASCRDAR